MAINPDLLSLKEAIKIVRPLNFKTVTEYQNWWRKNRPKNLALKARQVYVGNKQWPEKKARDFWSHYLGNKVLSNLEREWLSYEDASKACKKAGITGQKDFSERSKKGLLPKGVSSRPWAVYEGKGWIDLGTFLGTGKKYNAKRTYWPFKKARAYVHKLKLKNQAEWRDYTKSGKLPKKIPYNPEREYPDEWIDLGDWLGNSKISNQQKHLSYPKTRREAKIEARKIAKELGINSIEKWDEAYKSGKITTLPWNLRQTYGPLFDKRRKK